MACDSSTIFTLDEPMSSPISGGVFDENGRSNGKARSVQEAAQTRPWNARCAKQQGRCPPRGRRPPVPPAGQTPAFSLSFERLPQICWVLLEILTTEPKHAQ